MRTFRKNITFLLLVVLVSAGQPAFSVGVDPLLKNLQGGEQRLSDYLGKGKWVLFNVWGPKCPPCLEEVGEFVSFQDAHSDKDAIVVSMALDYPSFGYANIEQVATFADEYFINFVVLLGDSNLAEQVTGERLQGTPSTYLYAPDGELAAVQVGAVTQKMVEDFMQGYAK